MSTDLGEQFLDPKVEQIYIFITAEKGDTRLCSSYTTIALIAHASKILLRIIQDRLATYIVR
jgi:hypothetical protein